MQPAEKIIALFIGIIIAICIGTFAAGACQGLGVEELRARRIEACLAICGDTTIVSCPVNKTEGALYVVCKNPDGGADRLWQMKQ